MHVVTSSGENVPTWTVRAEEVHAELGRLALAVNAASEKLEERRVAIAKSASPQDAEILAVHKLILQDTSSLHEIEKFISEDRINAESAVAKLIESVKAKIREMEGDVERDWVADVTDPWRLVLDMLMEGDRVAIQEGDTKVVLAASELTPAVMSFLPRERLLAVATESGGRFSHGAVLARSMGVPCVIGLPNLMARLEQGMRVAVDGDQGTLRLRPDAEEEASILADRDDRLVRRTRLAEEAGLESVTPDGRKFGLLVNVESVHDFSTFKIEHTNGVGLLRTEFLYLERSQFPSEEEQYRLYRRAIEASGGRTVTIRLLDIGGDKPLPYFQTPKEPNPALGWRGLRIMLTWRDLLRVQLRALLRASPLGDLRILIPMVSSLDELRTVHGVFNELRKELVEQGYEVADDLPVGVMVEVPSLVPILDEIMEEADFLSVGTNDLVQYLLAVDRDNPWVASFYEPLQPAVFRTLEKIAEAAQRADRPVSVCGDIASDPLVALVLLGMGYHSVSVSPQFLDEIKYAVRRCSFERAQEAAKKLLQATTHAEILERMQSLRAQLLHL